jgi:hypothetical protein
MKIAVVTLGVILWVQLVVSVAVAGYVVFDSTMPLVAKITSGALILMGVGALLWSVVAMITLFQEVLVRTIVDQARSKSVELYRRWKPERVILVKKECLVRISSITCEQHIVKWFWGEKTAQYGVYHTGISYDVVRWCQEYGVEIPRMIPERSVDFTSRYLVFHDSNAAMAFKMRWC